jgi:hypothetical protein
MFILLNHAFVLLSAATAMFIVLFRHVLLHTVPFDFVGPEGKEHPFPLLYCFDPPREF